MDKQEAYKTVFDDMMASDVRLFKGIYDAKNGSPSFMYGVGTVLEYIASHVSDDCYGDFDIMFCDNLVASEERAQNESVS